MNDIHRWLFERIIRTAPEPKLTRQQKKWRRRNLKLLRRQLVYFAGHHYTRLHSKQEIHLHLLAAMAGLRSDLTGAVAIPQSLRFSLGNTFGGKQPSTWRAEVGGVAFYAMYRSFLTEEETPTP